MGEMRVGEDQPASAESQRDPRVRLAAERTLLAWVRTGLAMMGFGFVVARFGLFLQEIATVEHQIPHRSMGLSLWLGVALVMMGITANVLAALEYRRFIRRYERCQPDRLPHWSLGLVVAFMLAAVGAGMVGYLLSL